MNNRKFVRKEVSGGGRHLFDKIISLDNLFLAWEIFRKDKNLKQSVLSFLEFLEPNVFKLYYLLKSGKYRHGPYYNFTIFDPKRRTISAASVRDRLVHQAICNLIEPIFEKSFIFDSYSSRKGKGTHRAVKRLQKFAKRESRNFKKPIYALKCDIYKFFDSIDHKILFDFVKEKIKDKKVLWLVGKIIKSFHSGFGEKKGLPLGNLTSQFFANIYLNKLDHFVKNYLSIKHYIRFCDDFVILGKSKEFLEKISLKIVDFLKKILILEIPKRKIIIRKYSQGIDFLGYIVFPRFILPRKRNLKKIKNTLNEKTEEFINGKISQEIFRCSVESYKGYLKHANSYKFLKELKKEIWNRICGQISENN